jgi:hypothetical protein
MARKGLLITIVIAVVVVLVVAAVVIVLLKRRKQVFAIAPVPVTGAPGAKNYHILAGGAATEAKKYGVLATYSQIEKAQKAGAQWCRWGWVTDDRTGSPTANTVIMILPTQTAIPMCGSATGSVGISVGPTGPNALADIVVYGRKPSKSSTDGALTSPWFTSQDGKTIKWSRYRI